MAVGNYTRLALLLVFLTSAQSCGYPNSSASEAVAEEKRTAWQAHAACRLVLQAIDDDAIEKIQLRISRGVNLPAWFERLGWAYIDKATTSFDDSYYEFAQQTANCLQQIQAGNFEALLIAGYAGLNQHDFAQAEKNARRLTRSRDYWADHALLGDALLEQGDVQAAMQAYQALMDKRPGPQAYARAAELNWRRGELPSAIEFMQLALSATSSRDTQAYAWALTRMAELHLQTLNYALAAEHTQQALAVLPDYAPASHVAAKTAMALKEWRQAIVFNQHAIAVKRQPHYLWLHIEALNAAGRAREAAEVEEVLLGVAELEDPRLVAVYLASKGGAGRRRALSLAQHELQQRQDALSHDAVAWAYWSLGESDKALAHIDQALGSGLQDARVYYHAVAIYAAANKSRQATEFLQQAKRKQALLMPGERDHLQRLIVAAKPQQSQEQRLATSLPTTGNI